MSYYVGILNGHRATWSVRIPDLPGCHGRGATPEDAAASASAAAREWLAVQRSRGLRFPPPRALVKVLRDTEADFNAAAGEAVVLIPVVLDKGRKVSTGISLKVGLLEAINEEAKRRGLTRSAFIASAALEKISEQR